MFLLVEWTTETPKQYSVVSLDQIVDGSLRNLSENLIGRVVDVNWKGKSFAAVVLKIGEETDLTIEADELAQKAAEETNPCNDPCNDRGVNKKGRKGKQKSSTQERASTIDVVLHQLPPEADNSHVSSPSPDDGDIQGQNEQPDKYKTKLKALRTKYNDLKSRYNDLLASSTENSEVELYPNTGVKLPAGDLAAIKMASSKPSVLARNLFRRMFTPTELSTHSLLGKRCNANVNSTPLPMIDPIRRGAVIGFVLKQEGFEEPPATGNAEADKIFLKSKKNTTKEIHKSLSDFLREENKKQRVVS